MIIAYHLILSCYGFWLPNDPRGSWSEAVRVFELRPYGPATKVNTRASVAATAHDKQRREQAKEALALQPVVLNGVQARAVGRAIAKVVATNDVRIHAAALMPDHLHLVVGRHHELSIEQIARRIKARASQRLRTEGVEFGRSPWAKGHWAVYLNSVETLERAVRYVEENPTKANLPPQQWSFVTPFAG